MIRSTVAFVVVALLLVSKPLLGQNSPEQAKPAQLSTVALPPELDRVLRNFERAWRARDAVALASLFAEDGFVLQNNRSPIRGRLAIQAAFQSHSGGPLRLRSLAFSTGDTIGYIIGAYGYGDAPGDAGKFTLTLLRAPGGPWLIFSDMDNLNMLPKSQRMSEP